MASVSMDYFEAPLNPCSVESIQEPVELHNKADGQQRQRKRIWPVMLGCYELQENTGKRYGRLDLYSVQVPDMNHGSKPPASMNLRFGKPLPALTSEETCLSGILDGKWILRGHQAARNNPSFLFASAHSSGQISIHECSPISANEVVDEDNSQSHLQIKLLGKSEPLDSTTNNNGRPPLCLSLNWDSTTFQEQSAVGSRIVSTYSNGRIAVHNVVVPTQQSTTSTGGNSSVQLIQQESWEAHTMFTSPAEVWSAGFVGIGSGEETPTKTDLILSGGDEGNLKLWDLRSINRPMQVLKNHFDAGVTVVAPHPRQANLVACGSYDETIALYDVRYISAKKPLGKSGPLGGGIWRLKWHPYDDNRLLVAAMHGGCRIVQIDHLNNDNYDDNYNDNNKPIIVATKEFTQHKSMAYGADWLVCKHPTEKDGYFEAAASCSFYDKAVYLWDTVA